MQNTNEENINSALKQNLSYTDAKKQYNIHIRKQDYLTLKRLEYGKLFTKYGIKRIKLTTHKASIFEKKYHIRTHKKIKISESEIKEIKKRAEIKFFTYGVIYFGAVIPEYRISQDKDLLLMRYKLKFEKLITSKIDAILILENYYRIVKKMLLTSKKIPVNADSVKPLEKIMIEDNKGKKYYEYY